MKKKVIVREFVDDGFIYKTAFDSRRYARVYAKKRAKQGGRPWIGSFAFVGDTAKKFKLSWGYVFND